MSNFLHNHIINRKIFLYIFSFIKKCKKLFLNLHGPWGSCVLFFYFYYNMQLVSYITAYIKKKVGTFSTKKIFMFCKINSAISDVVWSSLTEVLNLDLGWWSKTWIIFWFHLNSSHLVIGINFQTIPIYPISG